VPRSCHPLAASGRVVLPSKPAHQSAPRTALRGLSFCARHFRKETPMIRIRAPTDLDRIDDPALRELITRSAARQGGSRTCRATSARTPRTSSACRRPRPPGRRPRGRRREEEVAGRSPTLATVDGLTSEALKGQSPHRCPRVLTARAA